MSDERFTQGEWIANGAFVEDEHGVEIVSGVFYAPEPELMANAHLISAAPDMYRALRELLGRIENDKDVRHWFIDEQALAIKALAKADGEQDDE